MTSLTTGLKGRSELGVALLLGAAGVVVFLDANVLVTPYSKSDPVGPKTVPFIVAGMLVVCAVLLAARRTARMSPQRLTGLQQWAVTTAARRGHNKAAIALANKLARIVWAVWHRDVAFHARPALITAA